MSTRVGSWIKNDKYASVVEWRDRDNGMLPGINEWVLIAIDDGHVYIGCNLGGGQWQCDNGTLLPDYAVQYWAPIPAHPEAEEEP